MKRVIYYLSSCTTCTRILKELQPDKTFRLQDIKFEKITSEQLDELAKLAGNYRSLFSKRAIKFRSLGLNEKNLDEGDYRRLILEEYTFLKRPVIVIGDEIFIGNSPANVKKVKLLMRP